MASAQQIGACGDAAFGALQELLGPPADVVSQPGRDIPSPRHGMELARPIGAHQPQEEYSYDRLWRESVVRAWLAPLLAGSVISHPGSAAKPRPLAAVCQQP